MSKFKNYLKKYWITFLILALIVAGYAVIANKRLLDPFLFPSTHDINKSFADNGKTMFINMISSFILLFPSLFIAVVISLLIGVPIGLNKRLREILLPIVYGFSVIPSLLLSPFLLLLAPSLLAASRIMIIYNVIWPTCFGVIYGIATIDKNYLDTADTLEIKGLKRLFHVIMPASLPTILSGFVSSLRGSFTVLVFAEMYGAKYGMGYFVKKNADFGLFSNVWSGFIFLVVVLVIVLRIFEAIKDRALRWTMD
ncbi:ABC transporter permease subunit [Finegoldia magna]|uniref:ABC transporter permease n=1 Tax=Finegoldia magna TaxID=1260 RepID=UPI00288A65DB|nr:ABC transporter permease subunit [Finegoldia magna]MBS6926881.1 ABC transporter permease subunit [Finegoldia magna]MDU4730843.1 ABC transporter permease subunit [Finegoldia magna]MDU5924410.1 ABC transporter permease subunit [Finegoldia magna]